MNSEVSGHRPLVFIHIPKTAGTSFINYLKCNFPPEEIAPPYFNDLSDIQSDNPKFRLFWGHFKYSDVVSLFPVADYVTFLRDPVARSYSQYMSWHDPRNFGPDDPWRKSMPQDQIDEIEMAQKVSFDEFILAGRKRFDDQLCNVQTHMVSSYIPDEPFYLKSAKGNLNSFAFVGIAEKFERSIEQFREKFAHMDEYYVERAGENRTNPDAINATKIELSTAGRQRLESLLLVDVRLYDHALTLFEK